MDNEMYVSISVPANRNHSILSLKLPKHQRQPMLKMDLAIHSKDLNIPLGLSFILTENTNSGFYFENVKHFLSKSG